MNEGLSQGLKAWRAAGCASHVGHDEGIFLGVRFSSVCCPFDPCQLPVNGNLHQSLM